MRLKFAPYILISFFIPLLSYSFSTKEPITLVKNSQSNYEIVLAQDADTIVSNAALTLQTYIEKISKAKIPITDFPSNTQGKNKILLQVSPDLAKQEISITSSKQDLVISGGSAEATRNAVFEFLEHYLHCKWLSPDAQIVPRQNTINLATPLTYKYSPNIHTRTVHSRLFYDNPEFAHQLKVTTEGFPYYVPSARVHTFNKFIPEVQFYEDHPEYFAMRGDKRLPTQLCLTNPKVLEIVKDSVTALFEKNKNAAVISVSTNDNTQYCQCGNCKKIDLEEGSPAGSLIRFVNEIADEFPDKQISTLAYQYTRKPCKTAPRKNVLITLCSIECDRSASIEEKCQDFAEDLRGWKQLTENIRIWDYTTQFTNFLAPFPNIHTLKPNIEFFEENNAKWIFEQHSSNPSELFELRSYMTAKLLWNPSLKTDKLIEEFTDGYYEESGPYVKKYIDQIHEELKKDPTFFLFLYGDPSQAFDSYLSKDLLMTYKQYFDDAEEAVSSKPGILKRVKEARLGVDFAILEACRKSMSETFSLINEDFVRELLQNFKTTCVGADITMMNEMRYSVDEYCHAYERMLDVAKSPNMARGKQVSLETNPKKYAKEDPQALTDGAFGGSSFYANWLGFEGNDLIATLDLGSLQDISSVNMAFLQVTNHIVFFPSEVHYTISKDGKKYTTFGSVRNQSPLEKTSKINDLQYFELKVPSTRTRYIKVHAVSLKEAPFWHHAAGLPSWIFADEIIVR